jgi:hypothetical protein
MFWWFFKGIRVKNYDDVVSRPKVYFSYGAVTKFEKG